MPKLSLFTPLGLLKMTSNPSPARVIYDAKVRALGGNGPNFVIAKGSLLGGRLYAESIAEAMIDEKLKRAGDQDLPTRVVEQLPDREFEFGVVPPAGTTPQQRKLALAARMLLPGGASRNNVENALRTLLGSAFIAYRTITAAERVKYPTNLGDSPQNLKNPSIPRKLVRLTAGISTNLGVSQLAGYTVVSPAATSAEDPVLRPGDEIVVEPEVKGRTEVVTVTNTYLPEFEGEGLLLRAVFNKAHEANAWCSTAPHPLWISTQRSCLVILREPDAYDPEIRRMTHDLLHRILRGISTWSIVGETAANQAGPFILNESPMNATPFGTITY